MAELFEALAWTDAVGSVGVLILVAAYFATQIRVRNSEDLLFPIANLIGATLIMFSLFYSFNLPPVLIEGFWIIISLIGVIQHFRLKARI